MGRRLVSCVCSALLLLSLVLPARAAQADAGEPVIRQILNCLNAQEHETLPALLRELEKADPTQAAVWEKILDKFFWVNQEMEPSLGVLPDGLPQDDSLAIVVMGLQLNENGSIKPELLDRLMVAVRSAEKYPNACIICTGGATSGNASTTEAGEMAQWLRFCGIDESRILLEEDALSTTENALNTCDLLHEGYPKIRSLAVITSDYHIRRSCALFSAAALYAAGYEGKPEIDVIAGAVCTAEGAAEESLYSQIWGMSIIAGVDLHKS